MECSKLNARALRTALTVLVCAGCSSEDRRAGPTTRSKPDRPRTRAATQTAPVTFASRKEPTKPPIPPAAQRLLRHLKGDDPNTRRNAAIALGRLGEPEAMWPLIQTGANDPDPNVRLAAVEAVAWWGEDPIGSWDAQWRKSLLAMRTPRQGMVDVDLSDWIQFFGEHTSTSYGINWRTLGELGIEPTTKVGRVRGNVPVVEALCRVLAGTGKPVGFTLSPRLCISSVQGLVAAIRRARRDRARAAAIRQWGERTEAGRRTLAKLQREIKSLSFSDIDLKDVIQFFREYSGAEIRVDWHTLLEVAGIEPSTKVFIEVGRTTADRTLHLVLQDVSLVTHPHHVECVVDDGVVFISTRKGVERRMAARKKPMPRLVPTRQEEEKRAVARLLAALKHKDPVVRRSVAWALGELRWFEAMWPLIQTAASDQDPNVRYAAAEAVTRLDPDPNDSIHREFRRRLLSRKIANLDIQNVDFGVAIQLIREHSDTSMYINYRSLAQIGVEGTTKISVRASNVTVGEALCRILAATGKPVGFAISHGAPLGITSVKELTGIVKAARQREARLETLRRWSTATEAGRRTMQKLRASIEVPYFENAALGDVVQYL